MTSNLDLTLATMAVGEAKAALRRRAEEEMSPYLDRLSEANEEARRLSLYSPPEAWAETMREQVAASQAALDKALELLGVQR